YSSLARGPHQRMISLSHGCSSCRARDHVTMTFLGTRGEIYLRSRQHRRHSALMIQLGTARVIIDCGADWLDLFESLSRYGNQITVPPRHRRDMGDIGKLAESIDRLGLLQPIVVYRNGNVLRAGERRLRACKQLGWDHIDCRYVDELNEFELM